MGHVWMLRRFGIAATAPMFIPGLDAMIRLKQLLPTPREDGRVGLAGPMWGLAAAFACWVVALTTHSPLFAALTKVGAWVNLFNLLPIWQLDDSRAFRALTRTQRWLACALILAAFGATREPLLLLILVVAAMRAFEKETALEADSRALGEYAFLVAALSALTLMPARV
jgi:Zn-dependent protease